MSSKPKRPIGITLLAGVFLWIGCIGSVLFPIFLIFGLATDMVNDITVEVGPSHPWLRPAVRVGGYFLVLIWYLLYVAYACIGFGLWKLRDWARKAVLGLAVFSAVAGVLVVPFIREPAAMAGAAMTVAAVVWLVLPFAWLVWYLKRPRVRFAFGAGMPVSSDALRAEPPPGMAMNGKILTATVMLATVALLFCTLLYAVEGSLRRSPIYQMTLNEAARSGCVAARIGTPFTPGWFSGGNMEESNSKGSAHLEIPVKGPKGKGDLVVSAEKQGENWLIDKLVLVQGGEEMQLLPSASSSTCQ